MVGVRQRAARKGQAQALDQVHGLQREGQQVTDADPHDGPPCPVCRGKGETIMTGRRGGTWIGVQCEDCRGTGLADPPMPQPRHDARGYKIPEDGEEYDETLHGAVPTSPLTSVSVCRACYGAGTVLSRDGAQSPCAACSERDT